MVISRRIQHMSKLGATLGVITMYRYREPVRPWEPESRTAYRDIPVLIGFLDEQKHFVGRRNRYQFSRRIVYWVLKFDCSLDLLLLDGTEATILALR